SVIKISHALSRLTAGLDQDDRHLLARQHHGLKRSGQVIEIDHIDAAKLGNLVQVEVICQHARAQLLRQVHQFLIDFFDLLGISCGGIIENDVGLFVVAQLLEHVQSASATVALELVGAVGNKLKLVDDKLRDDQLALK